jgi:hypothetical protein
MWGAMPPTFLRAFPGPRGRPDLKNVPPKKQARQTSGTQLRTFFHFVLVPPPPPGGAEGGSGLSFSFRSCGFGPDPGEEFNLYVYFDRKYSREQFLAARLARVVGPEVPKLLFLRVGPEIVDFWGRKVGGFAPHLLEWCSGPPRPQTSTISGRPKKTCIQKPTVLRRVSTTC